MSIRAASASVWVLCIGIAVLLLFYGKPLVMLAQVKWEYRNSPEIWIVPKPLVSGRISGPTPGSFLVSYFGYEFESPKAEVKEERKAESAVVLSFSDCAGMVVFKPHAAGSLVHITQQGPPEARRVLEDVYGKEAAQSDYALRRKILNMTPSDLSPFATPSQIAGNSVLLMLKGIELERFKNGLYSFDSPSMRGFLEGDIGRDKGVVIDAFDHQDHMLTMIVGRKPGKSCFAQAELNRIIFSLRPVVTNE